MVSNLAHEETTLDPSLGKLLDADVHPSGEWAGIFSVGNSLFVNVGEARFRLKIKIDFPVIRILSVGMVVVVDTRVKRGRHNAWIFDADGTQVSSFCAGDGVADVLGSDQRIVVTYFDEGVYGDVSPSEQGLVAFDLDGSLGFEYQKFVLDSVDISDCYCAAWTADRRVVFSPYTGFPLVVLDIESRQQAVHLMPEVLHGASAISEIDGAVILHSPYQEKTALYRWKPGQEPVRVGVHTGWLRGLWNGRFLSKNDHGFAIVCPK